MPDLLIPTDSGLYCPAGDFHVDPWKPVPRAVITHAHSDHAVAGCGTYLAAQRGAEVLRLRVGASANIQGLAWGDALTIGDTRVSLHPAGHILGSAQVRIEAAGQPVWVVSGDYKTQPDPTCDPFEPVRCDVFLTESTFGLPIYRWPDEREVARELNAWWAGSAADGATCLILAYSLGKTQRLLSMLDPSIGPNALHGAPMRFHEPYAQAGVRLPSVVHASTDNAKALKGVGLIIAPQSAAGTPWARKFAGKGGIVTAQASGWMRVRGRRRWRASDRALVLSDHADFAGLNSAIDATGATRIGVTHGSSAALARWLRERGLDSFTVPTRWEGEADPGAVSGDAPADSDTPGGPA